MIISDWKMDFDGHEGLDCKAPCDMYSVLLEHGIISDPYYGTNEEKLSDLSKKDSLFYAEFELSERELSSKNLEIVFLGIDTICDIYFNDTLLGSVKNMHRKYEFDIKGLAKAKNEIKLFIKSPVKYFEEMEKAHHLYTNLDTIEGAAHLRKALYMSGWDWAPKLSNMGIFRPVLVNCYDVDRLEDTEIIQHHENGRVRLELLATTKHNSSDVKIECEIDGMHVMLENGRGEIEIENPRLWWPNGYGGQELYDVTFNLLDDKGLLDSQSRKIGLRTLCLSQEEDEVGSEFCFEVNGIKIFSMGANYVPIDSLLSRVSEERTERLIKDAIFANFNTIRVWGGAYYPDDYFYDLCDKYGLIVWQDFMVACANIWLTSDMTDELTEEAIYNIKRIRHHACLGLLCGNNEMEEAICHWDCADGNDPLVRHDYLKLYEEILPCLCKKHAPYISYTPSSPTSGGGFDNPNDFTRGDVHFWNVWNGDCNFDEYRNHRLRFCSEYGFESLPSIKTIDEFCPKYERNLLSYTMESHQKHRNGNVKLLKYLAEEYKMPKNLEMTVYATQLNQANAIKYGVEHFRRCRGYTMGSIYWQFNDPWPVASWSSVDYYGRYKALHYFAKKFYQGVSLGLFNENRQITINVANETRSEFNGYIKAGVMKNDFTLVSSFKKKITIDKLSSQDVEATSNLSFFGHRDAYFFAELYDEDDTLLARSTELGVKPKYFNFLKPSIKAEVKKSGSVARISLSTDAFAKNVEISFKNHDIILSDNYFDLTSKKPYEVYAETNLTPKELLKEISIISVYDIPLEY